MNSKIDVICGRIDALLEQKEQVLVAIDGNCTAGKTTLAAALREKYCCQVFHMDDFFLRPEQRTPARLAEIGGNVDYERFHSEVLLPLLAGGDFTYRPYDCKGLCLSDPVRVSPGRLTVIEGSYSLHPSFGEPYDLKICLGIGPDLQRSRVAKRPAHLQRRFLEEWIPMENRYLDAFQVPQRCDLVFAAEE